MITVLFFAQLQETFGSERIEVEASNITVTELKEVLTTKFQLNQLENVMTAINEEFAFPNDIISNGDVVAFIPPVSGG